MANIELTQGTVGRTVASRGPAGEALVGLAAVVLSILGLAGLVVVPLAAIATITVGVALLFEAAAVAARTQAQYSTAERAAAKGTIGADSIAAIAAIALGVLSLIGLDPGILLPIATIILGAGLLLASGAPTMEREGGITGTTREELSRDAAVAASGVHALVGAGAVVLGILGVIGTAPPITMTLIAMLSIGGAVLLSGAAVSGRMMTLFGHGT